MKQSALERLQTEFRRWVREYNYAKKTELDPDQLCDVLRAIGKKYYLGQL
jgi:hypothetical protein